MLHDNIVKKKIRNLNKWNVENLPPVYLPYRFLHILKPFILCLFGGVGVRVGVGCGNGRRMKIFD